MAQPGTIDFNYIFAYDHHFTDVLDLFPGKEKVRKSARLSRLSLRPNFRRMNFQEFISKKEKK